MCSPHPPSPPSGLLFFFEKQLTQTLRCVDKVSGHTFLLVFLDQHEEHKEESLMSLSVFGNMHDIIDDI